MVSRLDRLFILLDTGSNESTRLAAAKQLGEVQRAQPNDLDYLLRRIKEYSAKPVWETRVAAGQATRYVLEHVEPWQLANLKRGRTDDKQQTKRDIADKYISENVNLEKTIDQFDIDKIISECPRLLSLDSIDGDDIESPSCSKGTRSTKSSSRRESTTRKYARKQDKEQLMRQRKLINKELGIGMVDSLNLGVKSTDIVSNDDLQEEFGNASPRQGTNSSATNQDTRVILKKYVLNYEELTEKLTQINCITNSTSDKSEHSISWPLEEITQCYVNDLFNASWETRHGAAICLREIVKSHGKSGGRRADLSTESNEVLNQLWLVDMALKAISILALDKFGDFLFDQVVAPVRENAAQLLGCCVMHMSDPNALKITNLLIKLLQQQNWETRHGGVLGLKYSLNVVNESLLRRILAICFEPIFKSLADPVDDVSAEAAAALVPVKDLMLETIPEQTPELIKFLWGHLENLDELTSSTSNIVLLLASLVTSSSSKLEPAELTKSIPRLWPLLNHSSTSVRVSVLKALTTLLESQKQPCVSWMPVELYTTALRLVYQRTVLENMDEVRPHIERVWMILIKIDSHEGISQDYQLNLLKASSMYLNYWLCLLMQPSNMPIDRGGSSLWLNINADGSQATSKPEGEVYIGSCTFNAESMSQQKIQVTKCRMLGTRLIGSLYAHLIYDVGKSTEESQYSKDTLKYLADMFIHYIKTKSANQRLFSGWTLESWAEQQSHLISPADEQQLKDILPQNLIDQLNTAIQEQSLCYDELASTFTKLQHDARDFVAHAVDFGLKLDSKLSTDRRAIYNFHQIQLMCELDLSAEFDRLETKKTTAKQSVIDGGKYSALYAKKINLSKALKQTNLSQKTLSTSVLSSLACTHISWRLMPQRLKLIIEPLLDSIEIEEEQSLRDKSTNYLVILVQILCENAAKFQDLIDGITTRLVNALSAKAVSTIDKYESNTVAASTNEPGETVTNPAHRIVLLDNLQKLSASNRATIRRQSSVATSAGIKRSHSIASAQSLDLETDAASAVEEALLQAQVERKLTGSCVTLCKIVAQFGEQLPLKLAKLWKLITEDLKSKIEYETSRSDSGVDSDLIKNLKLLEVVGSSLNERIQETVSDLKPDLLRLLKSQKPLLRHHGSQCIAVLCKLSFDMGIQWISENILPMLNQNDIVHRCGAIETIALTIELAQLDLVPKIDILVVPILRRMSDQNDHIRLLAAHCFGKLLSLMPLNLSRPADANDSTNDQRFIEQLLNPKKLDNHQLPFKMDAELRSYQQDGLNWLAFLSKFNLHGILCDEMGLGKTLMTICVIAANHVNTIKKREEDDQVNVLPSLIVCPTTLTNHWLYEVAKFLPEDVRSKLNPSAYSNIITDRASLREAILGSKKRQQVHLVVASYEIVRSDIDFFKSVHWNYCVLDEGHMIKNGKTKLSRAIRLLTAEHRLILSGTPIQNNVTELWSLFDFLMPGYLGSERQFNLRYTRPILTSREAKCSSREQEAGALAMESLHRQVLPFILRRLKEDVLSDLPPKIIQDYYCELSPLQSKLYEDFTRGKLCKDVTQKSIKKLIDPRDDHVEAAETRTSSKSHVFQALQYLKNVCNHPKLVLTEKHSQYVEIKKSLDESRTSLDDISHSSKLKSLKQLLLDCGIGTVANQSSDEQEQQQDLALEAVVNQHRALIFCQSRSMVSIVENDLLRKHLPSVTYLKLDGSTPTNQRQSIVERFNNDPSIDVLLLTTQIGGLGLNLTGADTVIFVEHDWNPTKDLQAMDRAHRIGQRKVVNVYRLITKGTLEEKIMGLQKFKTMVSNTVINQDNAGLGSMKVDQLFDLFDSSNLSAAASHTMDPASGSNSKASFMDLLPELWDQQQYETEYDLSQFVSSLNKNRIE